MITTEIVIAKLKADTVYTITNTRAKEPDLADTASLPIIYVGYSTIQSKNPSAPIEHDIYNMGGEDLVQTFEIQLVCKQVDLVTIWNNVYKALIGWNPVAIELNHSGMTYSQGGVIGLANDNLWWMDRWHIGFPTTV